MMEPKNDGCPFCNEDEVCPGQHEFLDTINMNDEQLSEYSLFRRPDLVPHKWETEEISCEIDTMDFWKCKVCGASGGPALLGDDAKKSPWQPFLAGSGVSLPENCIEAQKSIKRIKELLMEEQELSNNYKKKLAKQMRNILHGVPEEAAKILEETPSENDWQYKRGRVAGIIGTVIESTIRKATEKK